MAIGGNVQHDFLAEGDCIFLQIRLEPELAGYERGLGPNDELGFQNVPGAQRSNVDVLLAQVAIDGSQATYLGGNVLNAVERGINHLSVRFAYSDIRDLDILGGLVISKPQDTQCLDASLGLYAHS